MYPGPRPLPSALLALLLRNRRTRVSRNAALGDRPRHHAAAFSTKLEQCPWWAGFETVKSTGEGSGSTSVSVGLDFKGKKSQDSKMLMHMYSNDLLFNLKETRS